MYLNSIQIIGFIGKDPERRPAAGHGRSLHRLLRCLAAFMEER